MNSLSVTKMLEQCSTRQLFRLSTKATPTTTSKIFIGSIEEKPEDPSVLVSSPTSPLGKELLGKAIGDNVTYDAPAGKITVKIVGIR